MIEYITQFSTASLQHGTWAVLFIVFWAGFLTSLTPCLYPVIPLTVAYFGAQTQGSKLKMFLLALVYVLGVCFVYTALGIIAALTGTLFGRISNHPYMYFVIANICIILGIAMFDGFSFSLDKFISFNQSGHQRKGYIGGFLVGCSSGLILGACATPVMAVLLTYVASKQSIFFGSAALLSFALGKGVLLIAIATFSGFVHLLPKSGNWMNIVKKVLGFVLIGMGEYFLIKMGQGLF